MVLPALEHAVSRTLKAAELFRRDYSKNRKIEGFRISEHFKFDSALQKYILVTHPTKMAMYIDVVKVPRFQNGLQFMDIVPKITITGAFNDNGRIEVGQWNIIWSKTDKVYMVKPQGIDTAAFKLLTTQIRKTTDTFNRRVFRRT